MVELLDKEYLKLENSELSPSGLVNLHNNIIQLKINENDLKNHKNHISVDVKNYMNAVINLAEKGAANYDVIKIDNLNELLSMFDNNQKINFLNYFIRLLEKSSFKELIPKFQRLRNESIINNCKINLFSYKSLKKCLIYLPILSIRNLICTLILICVITNLICLEAPFEFMGILDLNIKYLNLSDAFLINHFLNVSSYLVGINSSFQIEPLNAFSMIMMILGKIFIYVYVSTLVLTKLTDLIKR